MAYDPNNIFARILRGELPKFAVYEDDLTLAFLDIMPATDGHTLVIPKEAAVTISRRLARRRGGGDPHDAKGRGGGEEGVRLLRASCWFS